MFNLDVWVILIKAGCIIMTKIMIINIINFEMLLIFMGGKVTEVLFCNIIQNGR